MTTKRPPQPKAEPGIRWKWRLDLRKWVPYVRVHANGQRKLYVPDQLTLTAARILRDRLKTQAHDGDLQPERYQKRAKETVQSLIDRYMPTTLGKPTAHDEVCFQKWWSRYCGNKPATALDGEFLENARLDLRKGLWQHNQRIRKDPSLPYFKDGYGRKRSQARVNRYTDWLRQVLNHAVNAKYLPGGKNPLDVIEGYPEYEPPVIRATPEQYQHLLAALKRHTPHIEEWLALSHYSGLRQGEQFNFRKERVVERTPDWWNFVIVRGKHKRNTHHVPVIPDAMPIIARLMKTPGPWLIHQQAPYDDDPSQPFPIERWYKNYWEPALRVAGLPVGKRDGDNPVYGFTWHCARHAFAENLINEGASGKIAQRAGRWSSEAMLDRYGKTEDLLPVREAMIRGAQRWKRMYGGTAVQATKPVFDEERFRQDHPALYAQYVKMIPAEPFSSGTSLAPEGDGEPGWEHATY